MSRTIPPTAARNAVFSARGASAGEAAMSPTIDHDSVAALLSAPCAYPHEAGEVEVRETHISRVFLAGRFAYKLKKPVKFDFLDFSTPERRRWACQEEVRLNRRLAPQVYLEALPVTWHRRHGLELNGAGEPVDWVVKMRRLPDEWAMDQLLRQGALLTSQTAQLASRLAQFYNNQPPLLLSSDEYRRRFERHVAANGEALLALADRSLAPLVKRAQHAQARFLALAPQRLESRVCDGRIIEGHGDLRPEHVYFTPSPVVIDCIEFNAEYRQLDVLDELAFFAMECDLAGAPDVGGQILDQYRQASGDAFSPRLLAFYKCYRACVRAKVALLAHAQHGDEAALVQRAERLIRLAAQLAGELGPPLLLVVSGESGTGKSTVAASLAESLAIDHLTTDGIRRELFGKSDAPAELDAANYTPQRREQVYGEMFRQAEALLAEGASVVLDGTFLTAEQRQAALDLALRHDASPLLVRCRCPAPVARQRIAQRLAAGESESEARPELHDRQGAQEAPPLDGLPRIEVDTTLATGEVRRRIASQLAWQLGLS